jgi:hypothetical protein
LKEEISSYEILYLMSTIRPKTAKAPSSVSTRLQSNAKTVSLAGKSDAQTSDRSTAHTPSTNPSDADDSIIAGLTKLTIESDTEPHTDSASTSKSSTSKLTQTVGHPSTDSLNDYVSPNPSVLQSQSVDDDSDVEEVFLPATVQLPSPVAQPPPPSTPPTMPVMADAGAAAVAATAVAAV